MAEDKRKKDFQRLYDLAGKRAANKLDKKMKSGRGFLPEGTPDRMRAEYQKAIYNKKANKYEKKNMVYSAPGEGPRYAVRNDMMKKDSKDSKTGKRLDRLEMMDAPRRPFLTRAKKGKK